MTEPESAGTPETHRREVRHLPPSDTQPTPPEPPIPADGSPAEQTLVLRTWQRAQWELGSEVTVEQLVAANAWLSREPECLLDLIFHEYLLCEQRGFLPDLDEFARRFPEQAATLRLQVAFHLAVQTAPPEEGLRPEPSAPGTRTTDEPVPAFPGYEVLDEVGFGGAGVLYRARQLQTNRSVAIKVLSAGAHAGAVQRARFRSEAELIARLHHPNIVQIYEAGEQQGCPYLVLEFVGGGSLRDRLQGTPWPPRAAAQFLATIAQALTTAHDAGIIHRDLTPANILFTGPAPEASPPASPWLGIPKITDFGLAKSLHTAEGTGHSERTVVGDVLGTPSYMSPEQASGRTQDIGCASDVYALGAILYELLTGRPPFRAVTAIATLQLVVSAEPVAPGHLQPGQPRDLETICLKCLQKRPDQRYATAAELADDLQRFLADEPIRARPISSVTRIVRLCRRKPLLVGLASTVACLLVVIAAGSMTVAVRLNQAAQDREAEAKLAEARVHRLGNHLGRRDQSLQALAASARMRPTADVRDEALAALALFDLRIAHEIPLRQRSETLLDLAADLQYYASSSATGEVIIRDLQGVRELWRIPAPVPPAIVRFSPDGRHLAVLIEQESAVQIWRLTGPQPQLAFSTPCTMLWGNAGFDFGSQSETLITSQPGNRIAALDLVTGRTLWQIPVSGPVAHLAIHPSRRQFALATTTDHGLEVRHLDDGRVLVQLEPDQAIEFLAWHPAGRMLATVDSRGHLALWTPDASRRNVSLPGHTMGGVRIAFNHSGTLLFSTAWDGRLRVWDPHWGKLLWETIGADYYQLKFSADDRLWAGDVKHGKLRIWQFDEAPAYRRLTPAAEFDLGHFRMASISRQGRAHGRLLAVAMEQGVGFWDLADGRPVGHLPIGNISDLLFDDAGHLLLASETQVQLWPVTESPESPVRLLIGPPVIKADAGTVSQMAGSLDGRTAGLSRRDEGALIFHWPSPFDTSVGQSPIRLQPHADVRSIALTPDGRLAATGSHHDRIVKIWDAATGVWLHDLPVGSSRVAFSPDGQRLLTTANGLEIWSVGDWKSIWKGSGTPLAAHAFCPDGSLVAVDSGAGQIILHRMADGHVLARLEDPYPAVLHTLTFAPDGRRLVGVSRDLLQLFVWDLAVLSARLQDLGIPSPFDSVPRPVTVDDRLVLEISPADTREALQAELVTCQAELARGSAAAPQLARCAELAIRLDNDEAAREVLAYARDMTGPPSLFLALATCAVQLGNWSAACEILERGLRSTPLSHQVQGQLHNDLAWYLALAPPEFRDAGRSVRHAHLALETVQGPVETLNTLNTLALGLYRQGELELAAETLKVTVRGSSLPAIDLYLLALCLQSRGEADAAASYASRAEYLLEIQGSRISRQQQRELVQFREEFQALRAALPAAPDSGQPLSQP